MKLEPTIKHIHTAVASTFAFKNDIESANIPLVLKKVTLNAQFSSSYILLLSASTIVCTLGLLLNSAPVVIGGMIISPLMWPLMKTAIGFSLERKSLVLQALLLLVFSLVISLLSSYLITLFSPIKVINVQITARTTPTLLDLVIAVVSGIIAALGIVEKKISDTLAGVAIATSLMPPLCVAGIGLALGNMSVSFGGFLLFFANVVSIIFASVIVFTLVGIKREIGSTFRKNGIMTLVIVLIITAIPLSYFLKNYSFKASLHQEATQILQQDFGNISPAIVISNVETDVTSAQNVTIRVNVLIPKDTTIDYAQKQLLVNDLKQKLHKNIDLQIFIQELLSLQSDEAKADGKKQQLIIDQLTNAIQVYGSSISINTLEVHAGTNNKIIVDLILLSDPSVQFTDNDRKIIETMLSKQSGTTVQLNISLLPRLTLKSQPDIQDDAIKKDVASYIAGLSKSIDIVAFNIADTDATRSAVTIDLRVPQSYPLATETPDDIKRYLSTKYHKTFTVNVNVITKALFTSGE